MISRIDRYRFAIALTFFNTTGRTKDLFRLYQDSLSEKDINKLKIIFNEMRVKSSRIHAKNGLPIFQITKV